MLIVQSLPAGSVTVSYSGLVATILVSFLGNFAITMFVARTLVGKIVLKALDSESPALKKIIDTLYAKEIAEREATKRDVDENKTRLAWIDGQIREQSTLLRDQIAQQGSTIANAMQSLSGNMREMAKDLADAAMAVADIKGFLRGSGWNGDERRRTPR